MRRSLLEMVEAVRDRLHARPDLFEVGPIELSPSVSEPDLVAIESSLGVSIPPWLRSHYSRGAGSLSFRWDVRPGRFRELGYAIGFGEDGEEEEDDEGSGQTPCGRIHVVHPSRFGRAAIAALAQFTNHDGDGWAIDASQLLPGEGDTAIVWFDHDVPGASRSVKYRSCETLFEALAEKGFAVEGDAHGIREYLAGH